MPARRVLDRWGCSPDIGLITDLVRSTFAGLSENRRNQLLGFVLWKYTWLKGVEIAEVIKRTPGAVSQIVRRIELKTTSDTALASALNTIKLRLDATPAVDRSSSVHPDDWLRRESSSFDRAPCWNRPIAGRRRGKSSALPFSKTE